MKPSNRAHLALGALLVAALSACDSDIVAGPDPIDTLSGQIVTEWNTITHEALVAHDEYANPMAAARLFAMVHLAQHDALNAIDPVYAKYAFDGSDPGADPIAAAAGAAYRILAATFPAQQIALQGRLTSSIAPISDIAARDRGLAMGLLAAEAILTARQDDGSDTPFEGDYTPVPEAGRYQFTPPFTLAAVPGWRHVKPFALTSATQFMPGPPPQLTSASYATAFNEVREMGSLYSTSRTAEQTTYANFWYEFSDIGWNTIARTVATDRQLGLRSTARLFALMNMAMSDAYVAGWEAKFHYDHWRPYTAIRAAATDGNPATAPDAEWEPALLTPPVQDYPSTHSALGNAAAAVLANVFGDSTPFTSASSTAVPAGTKRSFTSFSQAADENADSRVMAGLHFRYACDAGQELGDSIGAWVVSNMLRKQ